MDYVTDYFRWRQEDSHRNSLNAHCYWLLRKEGISASDVQQRISGLTNAEKNELLFSHGINYNNLPSWQRRGVGMYFKEETKEGYNPVTQKRTTYVRRALSLDESLPIGEDYAQFIRTVVRKAEYI